MNDNPEKFIRQIKGIRTLRVNAAKRRVRACEFEASEAFNKVGQTQQALETAKQTVYEKERNLLEGLVGGNYVKIDQVVQFSKAQQYSVKVIKDARVDIEAARKSLVDAKTKVENAKEEALRVEKKMIAIEEVEKIKPWKP